MALTADDQFEFRDLKFGRDTSIRVLNSPGIGGLGIGSLRTSERARPQDHGLFSSQAFLGERAIDFALFCQSGSAAALVSLLTDLGTAWAPSESDAAEEMRFRLAGNEYRVYGRPDKYAVTRQDLVPFGKAWVQARFVAVDPRIYGETLNEVTTELGGTTGGLGFPHGIPHGFGTVTPGTVSATNVGNLSARPVVRFDAVSSTTNPRVTNITTGEFVEARTTVPAGQSLTLDFAERSATLNGSVSRTGSIRRPQSAWFALPVGTTPLRFSASSGSGSMTVSWRDPYLF